MATGVSLLVLQLLCSVYLHEVIVARMPDALRRSLKGQHVHKQGVFLLEERAPRFYFCSLEKDDPFYDEATGFEYIQVRFLQIGSSNVVEYQYWPGASDFDIRQIGSFPATMRARKINPLWKVVKDNIFYLGILVQWKDYSSVFEGSYLCIVGLLVPNNVTKPIVKYHELRKWGNFRPSRNDSYGRPSGAIQWRGDTVFKQLPRYDKFTMFPLIECAVPRQLDVVITRRRYAHWGEKLVLEKVTFEKSNRSYFQLEEVDRSDLSVHIRNDEKRKKRFLKLMIRNPHADRDTGLYSCVIKENPPKTVREKIVIGVWDTQNSLNCSANDKMQYLTHQPYGRVLCRTFFFSFQHAYAVEISYHIEWYTKTNKCSANKTYEWINKLPRFSVPTMKFQVYESTIRLEVLQAKSRATEWTGECDFYISFGVSTLYEKLVFLGPYYAADTCYVKRRKYVKDTGVRAVTHIPVTVMLALCSTVLTQF